MAVAATASVAATPNQRMNLTEAATTTLDPKVNMGSSLNWGIFLGPQDSTAPFEEKDPKRDPNLEIYPFELKGASLIVSASSRPSSSSASSSFTLSFSYKQQHHLE